MYTIISQPIYAIYQQLSIKFRNGLVHSRAEAGCGQADQPLGLENPLATIWGPRFLGHTQRGLVCVYIHIYMSEYIYIYTYMMYIHIHILKMVIFKRNTISLTSGRNLGSLYT